MIFQNNLIELGYPVEEKWSEIAVNFESDGLTVGTYVQLFIEKVGCK